MYTEYTECRAHLHRGRQNLGLVYTEQDRTQGSSTQCETEHRACVYRTRQNVGSVSTHQNRMHSLRSGTETETHVRRAKNETVRKVEQNTVGEETPNVNDVTAMSHHVKYLHDVIKFPK